MLIRIIADDLRMLSSVQTVDAVPQIGDMIQMQGQRLTVYATRSTSPQSSVAAFVYVTTPGQRSKP